MTTYFYGMVPPSEPETEGPEDKIICLSVPAMLASLVYTNAPEGFTQEDARLILGEEHFKNRLDEDEEFYGEDPFDNEDEFYQFPQTVMLSDLPAKIQQLGQQYFGRVDSWLVIPASQEKELIELAQQEHFELVRDDALALAVDLFTSDDHRFKGEKFHNAVERLQQYGKASAVEQH